MANHPDPAKSYLFNQAFADASPCAMTGWDSDLRCRLVNRTYLEWIGRPIEAVVGRTRAELFGHVAPDLLDVRMAQARDGIASRVDFETMLMGEHRHFEVHCAPGGDLVSETLAVYVTGFDVTYLKSVERDLTAANLALTASVAAAESATRAKSAFLANISHEIRTPLYAILGLSHLVRKNLASGEDSERMGRVADAAKHLLGLLNGLLDVSKIEAGKLELEDIDLTLDEVLSRSVNMVVDAARQKGLELVVDSDHVPQMLRGDPHRLSQALVNLLGNAVKFTDAGSVTLTVRLVEEGPDGRLRLRFEVRDTGPGIPPEAAARLFGAFQQGDASTTRKFGGTGLGLAITEHLARQMGGTAGVQSVPGEGSCFWVEVRLESRSGKRMVQEARQTAGDAKHILVVDDLDPASRAIAALLSKLGHRAAVATSSREAIVAIRNAEAANDGFAAVLIDSTFLSVDRAHLAADMQALRLATSARVIALTTQGEADVASLKLHRGIDAVLSKPVTLATLSECLRMERPDADEQAVDLTTIEQTIRQRHQGARVLLAEDNPIGQDVGRLLLEEVGLVVDIAEDGERAVTMAGISAYDLILMDMQMPKRDGIHATRELRLSRHLDRVPIIAMTANAYTEDRNACLDAGMDDFLSKPVDPVELYRVLTRWLDGGHVRQIEKLTT